MESLIRIEALSGAKVKVIALNTDKHPVINPKVPESMQASVELIALDIKIKPNALTALMALNKEQSYFASRFYSKSIARRIQEEIKRDKPDLVILDSLFMAVYLSELKEQRVILRAHNMESLIWERQVEVMPQGVKRSFVKIQAGMLKEWEQKVLKSVHGIWAISEEDKALMLPYNPNVEYLPCTFEPDGNWGNSGAQDPGAYHIGAMDWAPNISGMQWFLDEVWKHIHTEDQFRFTVLSRIQPQEFKILPTGIEWLAERVEDNWFAGKGILVAPLLSGSGMRIKILEGMARGKAVLTTTIGAEGLGTVHGEHIHIEDEPEAFAKALVRLFNDHEYREEMGQKARAFAVSRFSDTSYLAQVSQTMEKWRG